jgi:hypothetical protein
VTITVIAVCVVWGLLVTWLAHRELARIEEHLARIERIDAERDARKWDAPKE